MPAAFALVVPFLGPLVAWLSPLLSVKARDRVWPGSTRKTALLAGLAVPAAIWVSLILFPYGAFLLVPLCASTSLLGWLGPSAIATVVYVAGCIASVRRGSPWVWPVGTVAAVASFSIASLLLVIAGMEYVC